MQWIIRFNWTIHLRHPYNIFFSTTPSLKIWMSSALIEWAQDSSPQDICLTFLHWIQLFQCRQIKEFKKCLILFHSNLFRKFIWSSLTHRRQTRPPTFSEKRSHFSNSSRKTWIIIFYYICTRNVCDVLFRWPILLTKGQGPRVVPDLPLFLNPGNLKNFATIDQFWISQFPTYGKIVINKVLLPFSGI